MIGIFPLFVLLNEPQPSPGITALIVSAIISAISLTLIFLMNRLIKGYDTKMCEIEIELEKLKNEISAHAVEREKQINEIDRKIYEITIKNIDQMNHLNNSLSIIKEKILNGK